MTITKHISLDDDSFEKMKPFVEKHNGNFSAALKEIIDQAGKSVLPDNSSAIDVTYLKWMLSLVDGLLVPDNVLDGLIDPMLIDSMKKLEERMRHRFSELGWIADFSFKYDNDRSPSDVLIELKGTPQKIKSVASIMSQYLVKNSLESGPLCIKSIVDLDDYIKIVLFKSDKNEAQQSLITFFAGKDKIIKTVYSRPAFWNSIIDRHLSSNYNMVTVHRNYFEDMLANKIPLGEITIENLAKKPIQEIPLKKMLFLIKEVYEISGIAERVDIDRETLILLHNYRNTTTIEKIKKSLVSLFEANGHLYDAKSTQNMIILTHRPDVGIKINEIVDNLKTTYSSMDEELIVFMTFLKGLKEMPDIPLSVTALGGRIGRSLIQEYGEEKNIKIWTLENFKNALETINSKIRIESESILENNSLLYTIKKCKIATEGNKLDIYVCHTIREMFKGALKFAFGNRAQLQVRKLLTHGDSMCEVVIRVQ